jgi:hypothetical protein
VLSLAAAPWRLLRAEVLVQFILAILLAVDSVSVPPDSGLYYLNPQGLRRIEGRAVTVEQSHNHVPLKGTLPGQGNKSKAEILSQRAEDRVSSTPVFYYRVPPGGEAAGAADLVLVKLKTTHGHREFDLSSEGEWKASSGIPLRSQLELLRKQVEGGVYRLVPAKDLKPGEYALYLFRGRELPGLIYDFEVEQ